MTYKNEMHITDADFITDEARHTMEILTWAKQEDDLDEAINGILGDAPTPWEINDLLENGQENIADYISMGCDTWDDIVKNAMRNMEQKC